MWTILGLTVLAAIILGQARILFAPLTLSQSKLDSDLRRNLALVQFFGVVLSLVASYVIALNSSDTTLGQILLSTLSVVPFSQFDALSAQFPSVAWEFTGELPSSTPNVP